MKIHLDWTDLNGPPGTIYTVRRNGIQLWNSTDRLFTDTAPLPGENRYEVESSMGGECGRAGIDMATGEAISVELSPTILVYLRVI